VVRADAPEPVDQEVARHCREGTFRLPLPGRDGSADRASVVGMGIHLVRRVAAEIRRDVRAVQERDPAAKATNRVLILATWPGVHALLAHRVAHGLYASGVPALPYLIAYLARARTGVEIHPAAQIGTGLLIDHGSGVVIGETAEIGDDVTIYQGVTLGGTGFQSGKRHPTVGNNVVIGSGAKLLGPIVVGDGSKIGANSVVIHDVPSNSTVVGNPGHPVRVEGRKPSGPDADWAHLPDPVADAMDALSARIAELEREVERLGGTPAPGDTPGEGERASLRSRGSGPSPAGG